MDFERPLRALKDCEEALRKLAAETAGDGDYDTLARLGATARAISEIAREWQSGQATSSDGTTARSAAAHAQPREAAPGTVPEWQTRSRRAGSRGYPKFLRRGDELVKIGWSKCDKREYQHRAGHAVLTALCQALLDSSKRRRLFTMDSLERQLSGGANAVPGYQTYVWLAWLRSAGLIEQHGRQGYSLAKPATFQKDVERELVAVPVEGS